ncbi:MAG: 4Fe-4S dicluster domain-containing protein [Bacteroidales bacterium]|nr:4Fe-4S dicluster domain-containing protein [Bacteroidales bacterium]
MNKQKIFQFDINKCVGCQACIIACIIENQTEQPIHWRDVNTFNKNHHPDLPVFYYSLACNHCQDAPCLNNCPALAYSKDIISGAIVHNQNKCIGCQYCTWACPYDAPKFNIEKGVIEKCTFCLHRTEEGLKPACANLCPTGALDYIEKPEIVNNKNIFAFTDININPSINFIPLRNEKTVEIIPEFKHIEIKNSKSKIESKISAKKEWPLIVFTLLMAVLASYFTAFSFYKINFNPHIFLITITLASVFSIFHLGKKYRAYRAIFNIKKSWLSREILFFGMFFILSISQIIFKQNIYLQILAVISGILLLLSIDKVYSLAIQSTNLELHSAHVFLSGFLFLSIFIENYILLSLLIVLKSALYIYRKYYFWKKDKDFKIFQSAWRLDLLISFPLFFWIFDFSHLNLFIFISIFIGEIIDRIEYYNELDIITPEKQMTNYFTSKS